MAKQQQSGLKLSGESAQLLRALSVFKEPAYINRQIAAFFRREAQVAAGKIARDYLSGGNGLHRRTGALARSMGGEGLIFNGLPAIKVGSLRGPALRYVAVQEYGTVGKGGELPTIVPKNAKNLAVPASDLTKTPAGVSKYASPRDFPGKLFYVPVRKGNVTGLLFDANEYRKILASRIAHSGSELIHGLDKKKLRQVFRGRVTTSLRDFKAAYILIKKLDVAPARFLRRGFDAYLPTLTRNLAAFIKALAFSQNTKVKPA